MVMRANKKGYTLTEMMIAVAILGIVMGTAPAIFLQVQRFNRIYEAKNSIQRDVRTSIDAITRNLRQAYSSGVVIDSASGQPPYSRISFQSVNGKTYSYYQQGTNLFQTVDSATNRLSENLRYIAFTFPRSDDPHIISVSITMEKATFEMRTKALQLSIEKVRIMN